MYLTDIHIFPDRFWMKYTNCVGVFSISSMEAKYANCVHTSLYRFTVSEISKLCSDVFLCASFGSEVFAYFTIGSL